MIKSFCRMISKRSCLLRSNFLNFFSRLKFLFRAQLVHAKVTLSDDREYYKKDVMMMIEKNRDDQWRWWSVFPHRAKKCSRSSSRRHCSSSSNSFVLTMIIISCLSRWSYCAVCLWELSVVRSSLHSWECSVSYYQSFFISVSLERSTSSSLVWASLRCLNCSSSFVARKYLNTLTISSKVFRKIIRFVSRLSAHIFSRRSSNFEHFSSVWCIVCLRTSHEHLENSIASILCR
jgi:hypothetical protein